MTSLSREEIDRVAAPLEGAWTLPPKVYTDAEFFQREIETVFCQNWICVGRVEQLPNPGDYMCIDLLTQPIVVTHDHSGSLHAFSRVCLHRAMPVAEGKGNATRFTCPYHNWNYELNGQLRSAPMMDNLIAFDTKTCQLPQLALEVWQGFIFVHQDTQAQPLSEQISALYPHLGETDFTGTAIAASVYYDSPWNWKLLAENFMEAYHHIGPHKDSLQPTYPARHSTVPDNNNQPWSLLDMPGGEAEPDAHLFAAMIYPTFLFAASELYGVWYQVEPKAHDRMDLHIHVLLPEEAIPHLTDDDLATARQAVCAIHDEDIVVNQGPWQGLHGTMTGQGRLSTYEKAIWQLNQLWLRQMGFGANQS